MLIIFHGRKFDSGFCLDVSFVMRSLIGIDMKLVISQTRESNTLLTTIASYYYIKQLNAQTLDHVYHTRCLLLCQETYLSQAYKQHNFYIKFQVNQLIIKSHGLHPGYHHIMLPSLQVALTILQLYIIQVVSFQIILPNAYIMDGSDNQVNMCYQASSVRVIADQKNHL